MQKVSIVSDGLITVISDELGNIIPNIVGVNFNQKGGESGKVTLTLTRPIIELKEIDSEYGFGLSNYTLEQLEALYTEVTIRIDKIRNGSEL